MSDVIIKIEGLEKTYITGLDKLTIIKSLDLEVEAGTKVVVVGESGSGKSTLLNIIGCLEKADAGSLLIDGTDALKMTFQQINDFRTNKIGFVWQNNARNLIPHLSAFENVLAPIFE